MKINLNPITCMVAILLTINSPLLAQTQFGIRAGANFSNVLAKDKDGNTQATTLLPGFHAGGTADIPLFGDFYLQPGISFSTKGYKYSESLSGVTGTGTESPYYLELPVNLLMKPSLGNGRLLIGIGPYVAYGIGGSWKIEAKQGSSSLSQKGKLNFKNDVPAIIIADSSNVFGIATTQTYGKPLDAGASLLLGYEFAGNIYVQLNGQLGLINTMPTVKGMNSGSVQKNRQFGLSVGYRF